MYNRKIHANPFVGMQIRRASTETDLIMKSKGIFLGQESKKRGDEVMINP